MIYLQYKKITDLLNLPDQGNLRLNIEQREQLRQYRDAQLQQQCCQPLIITKNEFDKPISSQIAFNHSHSQQYYALAYSYKVKQLGVDIEDFSRNVRMQALAEHYFHVQEIETWQALNEDRAFWFKVWTIKEAVLKAHSLGIRLDLKTLNTQAHPTHMYGTVTHPKLGQFFYQNIALEHSMLTVAAEQKTALSWA